MASQEIATVRTNGMGIVAFTSSLGAHSLVYVSEDEEQAKEQALKCIHAGSIGLEDGFTLPDAPDTTEWDSIYTYSHEGDRGIIRNGADTILARREWDSLQHPIAIYTLFMRGIAREEMMG